MGLTSLILGKKNPISQFVDQNRNTIRGWSAGLASGPTFQEGLSKGVQYGAQGGPLDDAEALRQEQIAKADASKNKTIEAMLAAGREDLANMAEAGFMGEAWQGYLQHRQQEMKLAQGGSDLPANVQEWEYYNALPDDATKAEYLRLRRSTPYLDIGTGFVQPDPVNPGTSAGPVIKKENYQEAFDAASGTVAGKVTTEQALSAPGDIAAGQNALTLIENIRNDPALQSATGMSGVLLNQIPGFDELGFAKKVEQLKSGAFLTAIEQLRGMGALSNAEGQTATAAITRLSTSLSASDFLEALAEYESIVAQGIARAQSKLPGGENDPLGIR